MNNYNSQLTALNVLAPKIAFFCVFFYLLMLSHLAIADNASHPKGAKSTVYILDSKITKDHLKRLKKDKREHTRNLTRFAKFFDREPYQQVRINGDQISKLPPDSVLLVIDSIALSEQHIHDIESYVNDGGSLLFNHMAGFYDSEGRWRGDKLVNAITGLKYNKNISKTIDYDGHFITGRMLSPMTVHFSEAKRLLLIAYEEIPLFRNQTPNEPDMIITDWSRTGTPTGENGVQIPLMDSGIIWHSNKKKGRWVYFNLPSNIFDLRESQAEDFESLLQGMVDFLHLPAQGKLLPYLDIDSAAIIFEDVEHQYETLNDFIDLALKYNMPMTTYQVAEKAKEKPEILERSRLSPLIEVGSHSYTHGPIVTRPKDVLEHEIADSKTFLDNSLSPVTGYRPPREEMDEEMLQVIIDAGYGYVFGGIVETLYPQMLENEFIQIPRLGSDDYEFFIKSKMSPGEILHTAVKEEKMARLLNGVYTLGVHTQMMTQPDRIYILDAILNKIAANPKANVITAEDMVSRVRKARQIETQLISDGHTHQITITNNNRTAIRRLAYRLYWQGGEKPSNISANGTNHEVFATHYTTQKFSDIYLWDLAAGDSLTIMAK